MIDDLRAMMSHESSSGDLVRLSACAELIGSLWEARTGSVLEQVRVSDRPHLRWMGADPRVLLLGHYDTVWPTGTLQDWPFTLTDGIIRGPGVLDMKAGIVQMMNAVALLGEDADHVAVLLTSDEEIGSPTSRTLIEEAAGQVAAVLVCEPGTPRGEVKIARRGIAHYTVTVHGRAAHAGEEPERGINASIELARQISNITNLASADKDTTVTPTVMRAGTTSNTVPESGHVDIDVRAWTTAEQDRVDKQIRTLPPALAGARLVIDGRIDRPPFEPDSNTHLVRALHLAADGLGLPAPAPVRWRSASDANITAGTGVPTLDGLGAVGAHPHGRDEHVIAATIPDRAALLAALIKRIPAE